jgi:glycosyltransferase involved in cell wall biosynthesis
MGRERLTVAVDATPLLGEPTGVGAFCRGVLGALGQLSTLDVAAYAVTWSNRHRLPGLTPTGVRVVDRAMPARPFRLMWDHFDGPPVEWFIGRTDVVHGTNFVVPPTRRAARVVTVHDLTVVRYPELCDTATLAFPRIVRRAVERGAWIHTHSRFVADEVSAEFGASPERVRVVHPGIPTRPHRARDMGDMRTGDMRTGDQRTGDLRTGDLRTGDLPTGTSRYILAVGTVEPRKDLPGLVRAFDHLAADHRDVALVLAGSSGWGADALESAVTASPWRDRIVRLGYVDDDVLQGVLAGATVLAYPSVYEGFGFPPLEAMAAGVPVVATAAGSIPEVVGDGALLVPPGDTDALAAALVTVLDDDAARDALVRRGRCRSAVFTWESCGDGLANLYADAARSR